MRDAIARLRLQPAPMLAMLIAAQWTLALAFALTVRHNGWLYGWRRYQGGDDIVYHSLAWLLGTGKLPLAQIGYAWPLLLAPLAGHAGPLVVDALPGVVLFQVLVLMPIGTICVYDIAARIAGRLFGYWAAWLWVVIPFAAIPLFHAGYHGQYVEQLLPHVFGLMYQADFPSMIVLLVSASFLLRSLDTGATSDVVLAGLAAGLAIGVKPANLVFLPAPALALLVARRWRELVPFGLALVPALVTLVVWKQRGLGYVPALSAPALVSAASQYGVAGIDALPETFRSYLGRVDLHKLHENYLQLREHFYSAPLLVWTPIAGLVALARRRPVVAVFLGTWLTSFVAVKGGSESATVYYSGTFFRLLLPAFPAFLLLCACIPLLVPALGRRVSSVRARRLGRRAQAVAAVVAVALTVPALVLAATLPHAPAALLAYYPPENNFVPVSNELAVMQIRRGNAVVLRWVRPDTKGLRTRFRILRSARGQDCDPSNKRECALSMQDLGWTRKTAWRVKGPPGRWSFRVALAADWLDDPSAGMILLSPPADVTVPG